MRESNSISGVITFGLLVFTIIVVPMHLFDPQGLPRYRALRDELVRVQERTLRLSREVRELRKETELLRNDPRSIERLARDDLGMVRDGEVVFQFPK